MQHNEDTTKKTNSSHKGRLLIVDDESRHADSLATMVASWGYDVETAKDGARAAGRLISKPFDVVLLDLHMPVADGYKVMEFIQKRELKTRVITISGDPSMDDAIKSLKKGADNFIRKPVSPVDLIKAIDESLRKKVKEEQLQGVKRKIEIKSSLHRMMFDLSPNLQFLLDTRGNFCMVNTVFTKATGYTKHEILGRHWSFLVEDEQIERMHHVFEERRTAPDRIPEVEVRLCCKEPDKQNADRKPRRILVALQSRRLYTQQGRSRTFFGTYGTARDITQYNKLDELNKYQEFHDTLTGLPNRTLFEDYLSFALTQAKQDNTPFCLLHVVLVDLKLINERYGHATGDECLKVVTARLKRQVRKGDIVSRIDGSEFVLLLPHIQDEKSVIHISEKLRIRLISPIDIDGRSIALDLTIGSSVYPKDAECGEDLVRHAQTSHGFNTQSRQRMRTSNWIKLIKTEP
jgi:diguanylate cyclase (GGDEF)-like protein/PAS domain S-box-containing protein